MEHVEMRHPTKLALHTVVGFHKDHPEYLELHKALKMRLQVYGVNVPYV